MKILCLYNNECAPELFDLLKQQGHDTVLYSDRLSKEWCEDNNFDFALSYTYRYIIPQDIIEVFGGNIVNLHNSFLPYNRGAAPNIWSIVEGTPRGVTLHYIDKNLDKGRIITQRLVPLKKGATLKSSYAELDKNAKEMFMEAFGYYDFWKEMSKKVEGNGSYHSVADTKMITETIDSYDISVEDFLKRIKK